MPEPTEPSEAIFGGSETIFLSKAERHVKQFHNLKPYTYSRILSCPTYCKATETAGHSVLDLEGSSSRLRFIKGLYWEPQIGNPKNIVGI